MVHARRILTQTHYYTNVRISIGGIQEITNTFLL